ncbi:hypothetical protein T440DRAFT_521073 [Plenodomus tracheiphilus IPT5]|uniref:Uncharacterized protein n=1 Tax=Plenodomus tracheiphilus IPT5 TaxID=1408161 RepID=A0A6A7AYS7_9PLEO|nr:hypothetical protein T440DRAFT_521073 [Plenodomus tracheiphilus IPT5]
MEGVQPESHAAGSPQIHPQLRQRMLNRAATFADGAGSSSPPRLSQRRSSLLSNYSDTRFSYQSSSDNLLRASGKIDMARPKSTDEPTYWISVPVVAAIVPAIVGLTYENGAAIATDLLILGMAAWWLHWCVSVPWHWYHAAQERHYEYSDMSPTQFDDDIVEEDEDDIESVDEHPQSAGEGKQSLPRTDDSGNHGNAAVAADAQDNARKALRREELTALFACFIGPLLGATLLHTLRGQLTRTEGIVSDFNLLIFILCAEYRPFKQVIKLRDEKILYLQRIVTTDPQDQQTIQRLAQRVTELEARLAGPLPTDMDITEISAKVTQNTQLQLDALTRAVRRYEKRVMTETMQTESRFSELEYRLRDALSLAAAAARTGQRPGLFVLAISWIISTVSHVLRTTLSVALYPFRAFASSVAYIESIFLKDKRQSRKRTGVNGTAYSPMSSSRIRSRSKQ